MRVFAYVLAAHAFAFGFGATANAADMFSMEDEACESWKDPCEKPALWSGVYVGGFVGGGWGSADVEDEYYYDDKDPLALNTIDLSALMAGLNVGYNVQRGNFVFGVEAGLGFMNLSGSVTDSDLRPEEGAGWDRPAWGYRNEHPPISATYDLSGNLYGELTGKLGYARDQSLFYVKGGGAFLQASFDAHYEGENCSTVNYNPSWANCAGNPSPDNPSIFDFGKDETLLGWTIGIGFEHAISDRMSLKLEYQHFDFGNISYKYSGEDTYSNSGGRNWTSTLNGEVDADVTLDVVKLGVNYKLQD